MPRSMKTPKRGYPTYLRHHVIEVPRRSSGTYANFMEQSIEMLQDSGEHLSGIGYVSFLFFCALFAYSIFSLTSNSLLSTMKNLRRYAE